ncbi:hypothetical protein ABZ608_41540 [Streptomyces sp. NPDC013172]|uniref:Uncharacterized protein n=1 Tax=Streptomyces atriruber TaxID=545121 RepID=A0ABV3C121_9ACTN
MNDRLTASTINDAQLDALYDERDRLGYEVQQWRSTYGEHALRDTLRRLHRAEAAIERVRKLASRWAVLRAYGSAATDLRRALDATEPTPEA